MLTIFIFLENSLNYINSSLSFLFKQVFLLLIFIHEVLPCFFEKIANDANFWKSNVVLLDLDDSLFIDDNIDFKPPYINNNLKFLVNQIFLQLVFIHDFLPHFFEKIVNDTNFWKSNVVLLDLDDSLFIDDKYLNPLKKNPFNYFNDFNLIQIFNTNYLEKTIKLDFKLIFTGNYLFNIYEINSVMYEMLLNVYETLYNYALNTNSTFYYDDDDEAYLADDEYDDSTNYEYEQQPNFFGEPCDDDINTDERYRSYGGVESGGYIVEEYDGAFYFMDTHNGVRIPINTRPLEPKWTDNLDNAASRKVTLIKQICCVLFFTGSLAVYVFYILGSE